MATTMSNRERIVMATESTSTREGRRFPVLRQYHATWERPHYEDCPRSIPWKLIEPHRQQAYSNHYQTLERLAERGGLSPTELYAVMNDLDWSKAWPNPSAWHEYENKNKEPHPDRLRAKEFVKSLVAEEP